MIGGSGEFGGALGKLSVDLTIRSGPPFVQGLLSMEREVIGIEMAGRPVEVFVSWVDGLGEMERV